MNLRYIIAHAWYTGGNSIKIQYPYIIANLGFPLSLLFIVGVFSHGMLLSYALVGGIVSIAASNGLSAAGEIAFFKLEDMYQDLIVTTRTSAMDYMLGEMIGGIFWSIPSIILFVALDIFYGLLTPYALVMTLIVALLVILSTASIAFLLSSFVKHLRNIWAVSSILSLVITVLPPTYYPYTYLPPNILWVLALSPTTPASVVEQGVFGLQPMSWPMLCLLVIEAVVYFLLARQLTKWREP